MHQHFAGKIFINNNKKILSMKIWYGKRYKNCNNNKTKLIQKFMVNVCCKVKNNTRTHIEYLYKFIIKLTCVNAQLQFFYANWRLFVNAQQKPSTAKWSRWTVAATKGWGVKNAFRQLQRTLIETTNLFREFDKSPRLVRHRNPHPNDFCPLFHMVNRVFQPL